MSDLTATNCSCGCANERSTGLGNSCIWIILLLFCCGGNGCGTGSTFGGDNNNCLWIILLLLFCGGFGNNGSGCDNGCY